MISVDKGGMEDLPHSTETTTQEVVQAGLAMVAEETTFAIYLVSGARLEMGLLVVGFNYENGGENYQGGFTEEDWISKYGLALEEAEAFPVADLERLVALHKAVIGSFCHGMEL